MPASLRQSLESTPATADGAVVWTPDNLQRKDYSTAAADWMPLSVLHALCNAGQVRDIQKVFQVPSVHIELESAPTYMARMKCVKAWADPEWPPCACSPQASVDARKARWRAKLVLKDGTASLKATCFDAFQSVVDIAAAEAGTGPAATPQEWKDETVVAKAMSCVSAVPLTVLVTVGSDAWTENMHATVQLVQKTYSSAGVCHPMKALVRLAPTQGACPPCELSQTSYDEALGLTVIDNIALHCFRCLVKVCDAPLASGAGEAAREISCVFGADQKYQVTVQDGDAGMRLREVAKDAHIHAVFSWESSDRLAVIAFVVVTDILDSFQQFFARDVELQREATRAGPSFKPGIEDTPGRVASAAERADLTSPPAWKVRKSFDL